MECNLTRCFKTQCCFREGGYHDSSWFFRKRSFAPPTRYNSWQGLKIATRQISLQNSLRSPRPVNEFRTISASIEQPESVFNILHTGQSEVILEFPRKNSSSPSKNCGSLFRNVKQVISIEGFRGKRAYIAFFADFHFLQDRANFWQTDLFWQEKHRSVIVSVDLRFVLQKWRMQKDSVLREAAS